MLRGCFGENLFLYSLAQRLHYFQLRHTNALIIYFNFVNNKCLRGRMAGSKQGSRSPKRWPFCTNFSLCWTHCLWLMLCRFVLMQYDDALRTALFRSGSPRWLPNVPYIMQKSSFQMDHFIPESYRPQEWKPWTKKDHQRWADSIGNLVFLGAKVNAKASNKEIREKVDIYRYVYESSPRSSLDYPTK